MPIEILMPALSPTMTEGNLAKWIKKEGDKVKAGEVLCEIETDKATMEVEAVDEGILAKILVAGGTENVAVNAPIALLLEEGEDAKALEGFESKVVSSKPKEEAKEEAKVAEVVAPTPPITNHQSPITPPTGRIKASPLAKRLAAERNIDLSRIQGSGPHGRIVKADLDKAPSGGAAHGVISRNQVESIALPNNNMRKVIAKRLLESKLTIPHFYLSIDVQIDALLKARAAINEKGAGAYKISVNDIFIKAIALGLRDVPAANGSWTDAAIIQYNNVDISVAVAIDGGLITPVIRNADQKTLMQISGEMKDLATRAKAGKLAPEEFQGGGFSISNLGMMGIKNFSAIVNPPQSCIMAVGAGEERVIVKNGQIQVANMVSLTISCDHRVVDGAVGAEFLAAFKAYIEEPILMFV
jgi:pyruvate dehydrogenase E2 component (dihydrolipoamide acetyltransferase)